MTSTDDLDQVLVWFSCHRDYFRFRFPELTSIVEVLGISSEGLWKTPVEGDSHAVPNPYYKDGSQASRSEIIDYADYGSEDCITLGKVDGVFVWVRIPFAVQASVAADVIRRSVLVKGLAEIWAHGQSYEEVIATLKTKNNPRIRDYINPVKTFSFLVDAFGNHLTQEQQIERMAKFTFLFSGQEKANLSNPDTTLVIFEKWSRLKQDAEPKLEQVYFGRAISVRPKSVPWWWKYRLTTRPVLGPTTIDNELAFIMANQAQVKPGMVVLDPFCGTGGILISASHFGAMCIGSDIDARVLKGWGVSQLNTNIAHEAGASCDVFSNFDYYQLLRPDIIRMDAGAWSQRLPLSLSRCVSPSCSSQLCCSSCSSQHSQRPRPWVDAIITDPPYGVRASVREARDSLTVTDDTSINANECPLNLSISKKPQDSTNGQSRAPFIPPTSVSTVDTVIGDLLNLASLLLTDCGKLVFLFPVKLTEVTERLHLLEHQDLILESASLQSLSGGLGRVLITMRRRERAEGQQPATNLTGNEEPISYDIISKEFLTSAGSSAQTQAC